MSLESPHFQHENTEENTVQKYLSNLGLSLHDIEGKKILDVGSGDGAFVRFANKNGADAVGLDNGNNITTEELKTIQSTNTPFVVAEAHKIPFDDAVFDLVVSHAAIPNIASPNFTHEGSNTTDPATSKRAEQERRLASLRDMLRVVTPNGEVRCAPVIGNSEQFRHQAAKIREVLNKIAQEYEIIEEPISEFKFRLIVKRKSN